MKFKVALSTVAALIATVLLGAVAPASAVSTSTAADTTLSTFNSYGTYDRFTQDANLWWDQTDGTDVQLTSKFGPAFTPNTTSYTQYSDTTDLIIEVGANVDSSRVSSIKVNGVDYNTYMSNFEGQDTCLVYDPDTDTCTGTGDYWDYNNNGDYDGARTDNVVSYPMSAGTHKLYLDIMSEQQTTVTVTVTDGNGTGSNSTTYTLDIFERISPKVQLVSVSPNSGSVRTGDHVTLTFSGMPNPNELESEDAAGPFWRSTNCWINDIYFGDERHSYYTASTIDGWFDPATGLYKVLLEAPEVGYHDYSGDFYYDWADSVTGKYDVRASTRCDHDYERWNIVDGYRVQNNTNWNNDSGWPYGDESYYRSSDSWTNLKNAFDRKLPTVDSVNAPDVFTGGSVVEVSGIGMNYGSSDDGATIVRLIDEEAGYEQTLSNYDYTGNELLKVYVDQDPEEMLGYDGENLKLQVIDCAYYSCNYDNPLYEKSVTWKAPVPTDVTISPAFDNLKGGKSVKVKGKYLEQYYYAADFDFGGGSLTDGDTNWASYDWDKYYDNKFWTVYNNSNTFEQKTKGTDVLYLIVPEGVTPGKTVVGVRNKFGDAPARTKFIYGDKPEITSVTPASVAIAGGSTITLVGKNFGLSGTPTVTIGGEKSPFVVRKSATKVTAVVPAHAAGAVDVNIINPNGGGGNTTPGVLTYVANGTAPTVTTVAPATTAIAGGAEVTITGSGFGAAGTVGVVIGGKHAKVTASSATSITVEVPEGDALGAVSVVVSSTAGVKTKASALTYVGPAGISSITPNVITSYSADLDSNVNKAVAIAGSGFGATGTVKFGAGATCATAGTSCFSYTGSNGTSIAAAKIDLSRVDAGSVPVTVYPAIASSAVSAASKGVSGAITVTGPSIDNVTTAVASDMLWNADSSADYTRNPDIENGGYTGNVQDAWSEGGAALAITGKGFGSTAGTIKVGTVTATVTAWSDTRIEFTSPVIAAGDYSVTVQPVHGVAKAIRAIGLHVADKIVPPMIKRVYGEDGSNYFYQQDPASNDNFTVEGSGFLGTDNGASTVVAVIGYSQSDSTVNCGETFDIFTGCADNDDYAYEVTPASFTNTSMVIKAPRNIGDEWGDNIARVYIKTNVGVYELGYGIYYPRIWTAPAPTVQMHTDAATAGQGDGYGICVYPSTGQGASLDVASGGYTTAPTFTFTSSDASTWATSGNTVHPIVTMSDDTQSKTLTVTDDDGNANTGFSAAIPNNWTAWTNPWGAKKITVSNLSNGNQVFNFTCKVKPYVNTTVGGVASAGGTTSVGTYTQTAETMASNPPAKSYAVGTGWIGSDTFVAGTEVNGYETANQVGFLEPGRFGAGLPDSVGNFYVRVSPANATYDTNKYLVPYVGKVRVALTGSSATLTAVRNTGATEVYHGQNFGDLDGTGTVSPQFGFTVTPAVSGNSAVTKVVYEYKDKNCDDTKWRVGLPRYVVLTDGSSCSGTGTTPVIWQVRVRSVEMTSSGSNYGRFFTFTKGAPVEYTLTPRPVGATIAKPTKYYDGSDQIKLEISELKTVEGETISGVLEGDNLKLSADSTGTFAEANAGDREVTFGDLTLIPAGLAPSYHLVAPASTIPGLIKKSTALLALSTDKKVIRSVAPTTTAQLSLAIKDLYSGRDVSSETGTVSLRSTTAGKCTVDSDTKVVTPVDGTSGDCIIAVSQESNDNFNVSKSATDDSQTIEYITIKVVGAAKTPVVVVDDIQMSTVDSESGFDASFQPVGLIEGDETEITGVNFTITKVGDNAWTVPNVGDAWPLGTYIITASGGQVSGSDDALQSYTNNGQTLSYVAGKLVITVVPPQIDKIEPPQGPEAGGTSVSIKGTDFDNVTAITIGDVVIRAPKFTFVNGTDGNPDVLTFNTPAGYGSADVILKAGNLTAEDSFTYIAPNNPEAKITSIDPKAGPNEGGTKITITGTHLELVTSIKIGPDTLYAADFKVNAEGTEITFFSPGGSGKDTITLVTDQGADPTSAFTYIADAAPDLNLALDLEVGAKLNGAKAELTGGGLQSESEYQLEMHSTVVIVYTGTTDANGNFTQWVTMPKKACVDGGRHKLILKGTDPDGKSVTSIQYIALADDCKVLAISKDAPITKAKFTGFLFKYNSAKLTKKAKRDLRIIAAALTGAKKITIYGYTQTDLKSAAAKAANKKLGLARAKAVKAFLKKLGVKAKYVTVGRGPVKPVSTKKQKKNRRVVIVAKYLL